MSISFAFLSRHGGKQRKTFELPQKEKGKVNRQRVRMRMRKHKRQNWGRELLTTKVDCGIVAAAKAILKSLNVP